MFIHPQLYVYFNALKSFERCEVILQPLYYWLRLRLHGIGCVQIRLESGPLWYGPTLFTRDRFETAMVRCYMESPSQVNPFGTRQ